MKEEKDEEDKKRGNWVTYLKSGAKARDWAQPVLSREQERLERPKVRTQNAPTNGRRRRKVVLVGITEEETIEKALLQRAEAIGGPGGRGGFNLVLRVHWRLSRFVALLGGHHAIIHAKRKKKAYGPGRASPQVTWNQYLAVLWSQYFRA